MSTPSFDDMLGPDPEAAANFRKMPRGSGQLHTTGKAAHWNCTGFVRYLPDPQNFPGYIKTETLTCGLHRAWFETRQQLDAYCHAFSAAPSYNLHANDAGLANA
jgi:hypothetical protein